MKRHPIELNPGQMALIHSGMGSIPPVWRERYRAAIADALMGRPVTNATVTQAVGHVTRAIILGAGEPDTSRGRLANGRPL
jgi:hypothetical protein